jgi:hypothetical protein
MFSPDVNVFGAMMAFPEKFRALIELREDQVTIPDYVWLAYGVCALEDDSCGWRGWIMESARKRVEGTQGEREIEADTEQVCPVCGRQVYRTGIEKCFRLDPNSGPKIDYAYDAAPVTFTGSVPKSGGRGNEE